MVQPVTPHSSPPFLSLGPTKEAFRHFPRTSEYRRQPAHLCMQTMASQSHRLWSKLGLHTRRDPMHCTKKVCFKALGYFPKFSSGIFVCFLFRYIIRLEFMCMMQKFKYHFVQQRQSFSSSCNCWTHALPRKH